VRGHREGAKKRHAEVTGESGAPKKKSTRTIDDAAMTETLNISFKHPAPTIIDGLFGEIDVSHFTSVQIVL